MGGWRGEQREPQPTNKKLLPVGNAAITRTHTQIASLGFSDLINFETDFIERKNSEFQVLLNCYFDEYQTSGRNIDPAARGGFMDGAVFVHTILRDPTDNQIPTFIKTDEIDDASSIYRQEMRAITSYAEKNGIDPSDFELIASERITDLKANSEDPVLGEELLEQAFQHQDGPAFLVGAMAAYFSIKTLWLEREEKRDEAELAIQRRGLHTEELPEQDSQIVDGVLSGLDPTFLKEFAVAADGVDQEFSDLDKILLGRDLARETEIFLRDQGKPNTE